MVAQLKTFKFEQNEKPITIIRIIFISTLNYS